MYKLVSVQITFYMLLSLYMKAGWFSSPESASVVIEPVNRVYSKLRPIL
jgi:hypothetical protein